MKFVFNIYIYINSFATVQAVADVRERDVILGYVERRTLEQYKPYTPKSLSPNGHLLHLYWRTVEQQYCMFEPKNPRPMKSQNSKHISYVSIIHSLLSQYE